MTYVHERLSAFHNHSRETAASSLTKANRLSTHHKLWVERYFSELSLSHTFAALAYAPHGEAFDRIQPLVVSWHIFVFAADVYDDIQDGEVAKYGAGLDELLSFALLMVASSYRFLCDLDVPSDLYRKVETRMRSAYLAAARGQMQHSDIVSAGKMQAQQSYISKIVAVSATPFAQYLACGALLATPPSDDLTKLFHKYGTCMGIASQLKDDLDDLSADLIQHHYTLPVLDGLSRPEHHLSFELKQLIEQGPTAETVERVIEILSDMGSIQRVHTLMRDYQQTAVNTVQSVSDLIPKEVASILTATNQ